VSQLSSGPGSPSTSTFDAGAGTAASPDDEAVVDLRDTSDEDVAAWLDDDPLRPLVGKVAVVTGGGGPVGRAIALALLDAGARVCVLDRDVDDLRGTTAAAPPSAPILYLQCDLGSANDVAGAADFITRFDRPVDVLVHAADVHVAHGVGDGIVADLDEQYLVNLRGPYLVTQQLVERLREGPGHVVFINPGLDADGVEDTQYGMTRAGIGALATGIRRELDGSGVRVTTIHVGTVFERGASSSPVGGRVQEVDIADCVMGALEMPSRVEISELHLRPRAVAR
jgi:NAD(P)-dependent dehydrogenase (short-subunit alcohol dehydrogenase family)